jgi:superfamily II DNA or RNA helicase
VPHDPSEDVGVRLRAWQREALRLFEASAAPDFLAVATPGAGKTTFALTAARRALLGRRARRLLVVVPTQHLKTQWAHAAERFDLHLDPEWASAYGALPSDVHGVVVTYQQVAANPGALRPLVKGALVVLDEIHHAGESRSWGDGVRFAFEPAVRRLCLSGTPFRSDASTIPFVRYDNDLAKADYDYGYGEALKDRAVVRPVYFPRINGHMEWTAPDGSQYAATFDDKLTKDLANQRLRTALAAEGEWLSGVLTQAHAQLTHLRKQDPRAGGLVIAIDQEHARAIAEILHDKLRVHATIATSDDPAASRKIAEFGSSHAPWLVAVRMVSEGVDIPRLRVGVYATSTLTELFFRQAVGRLVRWHGGTSRQTAYMFIPDDPRLRHFAAAIAEQRRHCLQKKATDDEGFAPREEGPGDPAEPELLDDAQGNLFEVISAVPLDEQGRPLEPRVYEELGAEEIPDYVGNPSVAASAAAAPEPAPPRRSRPAVPLPDPEPAARAAPAKSALARRRELREANGELVRELVHVTGKSHAELNAELNRKAGIKSVAGATVKQLEQRLAIAKKLLDR